MIKTICSAIALGLFYICWVPAAIIKDIISILYVPFSTQRLMNSFNGLVYNSKVAATVWGSGPEQQTQQQPEPKKPVGFRIVAQQQVLRNPQNPNSSDWAENDL